MTTTTINNTRGNNTNSINTSKQQEEPKWIDLLKHDWGEELHVPEWDNHDDYRRKNGWHGRDLMHDETSSPVYISRTFVRFGNGDGILSNKNKSIEEQKQQSLGNDNIDNDNDNNKLVVGGVGTQITSIVHFTSRAESHRGYCHGGSMCSIMDDIIGWCSFVVSGRCIPWSGYTVQINTSLLKPIPINTTLIAQATITKIEKYRKVHVSAELYDPGVDVVGDDQDQDQDMTNNGNDSKKGSDNDDDDLPCQKRTSKKQRSSCIVMHARGDGLCILNHGVLMNPQSKTSREFENK